MKLLITLVFTASVALGASGCASGQSGDARALLGQAFAHPVRSGDVTLEAQATVGGVAALTQPASLKLTGPYQSNGAAKIPSLDWDVSLRASGRSFSGKLISTGDNAYVGIGGTNYEVGPQVAQIRQRSGGAQSLKQFGIDPNSWVTGAHIEGSAQVAGADTTHVRAGLDITKLLHDFNKTISKTGGNLGARTPKSLSDTQIAKVRQSVKNPTFDIYVAKSDKTVRRLAVAITFTVPQAQRQQFRGANGGMLSFSVEIANIGKRSRIMAPPNPRPLAQLAQQFGALGGGFGSPGGGGATPQAGGGADPRKLQAYQNCLTSAGASVPAVQRCTALLR